MKTEQGTQINATGAYAQITEGDYVDQATVHRQRVGTQHVSTMFVTHPPAPRVAHMEPCPNPDCQSPNSPHADKCRVCEYPIAQARVQRNAFLLARRQNLVGTLIWTVTVVFALAIALVITPSSDNPAIAILHIVELVAALMIGTAVWVAYWWHYGRHA